MPKVILRYHLATLLGSFGILVAVIISFRIMALSYPPEHYPLWMAMVLVICIFMFWSLIPACVTRSLAKKLRRKDANTCAVAAFLLGPIAGLIIAFLSPGK